LIISFNIAGALMTAGVLTAGLISFRRGNSQLGQVLMRARVVVQGATVALMVGTGYYYGDNPWKKWAPTTCSFSHNWDDTREICGQRCVCSRSECRNMRSC